MFRLAEEFKFSVSKPNEVNRFVGQLVFKNRAYNDFGTLYTNEEQETFGQWLNNSIGLPEYFTLEMLAHILFLNADSIFSNLHSINVYREDEPHRIAEYERDFDKELGSVDGDFVMTDAVN